MHASKTCVRFLPLLGFTGLAACATPPGSPTAPSQTVATTANSPLGQLALALPQNSTRPRANSNRVLTDKDLENIDGEALRANYGEPSFVRKEVEAQLWRYDARDCAVFFFLYRDGTAWRLRHAESNPRGPETAVDPGCLEKLTKRPPPVS